MPTLDELILYEDNDVLVINKPAAIATHPGHGTKGPTIVDLIRNLVVDNDPMRPGIVHRLDKDTSGVLLIAKNPKAKAWLQEQFKKRSIHKVYLALAEGHLKLKEAVLDWPIGRHRQNPLKRAVVASGKGAQTHYKVIEEFSTTSLLEIYPKTGRTHQIRVHLAHLGHPLVGDKLYNPRPSKLNRQFLHAKSLEFTLPNGRKLQVTAPLNDDLANYLSYNK